MNDFFPEDGLIMDDIVNTGEQHIACVLLVDVSGSMTGKPIEELNKALIQFGEVLKNDPKARGCADVSVIAFNQSVNVVVPFCPAESFSVPYLTAGGMTAMNEAIITGLDLLEQRKKLYRNIGTSYFRPWMFLMTDGAPTDVEFEKDARDRLSEAIDRKKVSFFPLGIGENARRDLLKSYNNNGMVMKADAENFAAAFTWLSKSLTLASNSKPSAKTIVVDGGFEIEL